MCLLVLGYCGLLRTGELLSLRCTDISFHHETFLVFLANTKTGSRLNKHEHIVVRESYACAILRCFLKVRGGENAPIWLGSG